MSDFEHPHDERLGATLREQLHAAVQDLHPSAKLLSSVDSIPSGRGAVGLLGRLGRKPRRLAFALPVPVAAVVATLVIVLSASSPAPVSGNAFTVLPNGDVRVFLSQMSDVAAANAQLRKYHIRNTVVVPMTASCRNRLDMTYTLGAVQPNIMTLKQNGVPPGYVVVLAAKQVAKNWLLSAFGRFRRGHVPTCASSHGWGPGMGDIPIPGQTVNPPPGHKTKK